MEVPAVNLKVRLGGAPLRGGGLWGMSSMMSALVLSLLLKTCVGHLDCGGGGDADPQQSDLYRLLSLSVARPSSRCTGCSPSGKSGSSTELRNVSPLLEDIFTHTHTPAPSWPSSSDLLLVCVFVQGVCRPAQLLRLGELCCFSSGGLGHRTEGLH